MHNQEVISLLQEGGGIFMGHFAHNREWHSDLHVGKFIGFHNPAATEKVCCELLNGLEGSSFDLVIVRGVPEDMILGYVCARILNAKMFTVSKDEGLVNLMPHHDLRAGSRALVVANSFHTPNSLREIVVTLSNRGIELAGIAVLVDEAIARWYPQVKVSSLVSLEDHLYRVESCPLCIKDVPLRGASNM